MNIYEAFNWIKAAEYTAHGYIIFNQDSPEGKLKGEALKTIFEAAKNGQLVSLEVFEQVRKERNEAVKRLQEFPPYWIVMQRFCVPRFPVFLY